MKFSLPNRSRRFQQQKKNSRYTKRKLLAESLEKREMLTTFTVTNLNSNGPGSLRDAIQQANTNPGEDRVEIDQSLFGDIELGGQQIEINDSVEIVGNGFVAIDGENQSRIFDVGDGNEENIVEVDIERVVLVNGQADNGGLIRNRGEVISVDQSTLSGGQAENGGAIHSEESGSVLIFNSTLDNNSATGDGGAIDAQDGTIARIFDSNLFQNTANGAGGAISGNRAIIDVNRSNVTDNEARSGGGGIHGDQVEVEIDDSTVSNNRTTDGDGGGLEVTDSNDFGSRVQINNSNFTDNSADSPLASSGGAIDLNNVNGTINNSTISGNTSDNGGGTAFYHSDVEMNNTTIEDNEARQNGGGVYSYYGRIRSVTLPQIQRNVAGNAGGGIAARNAIITIAGDASIAANVAATGGGIDAEGGELNVENATINNNQATNGSGGGISAKDMAAFLEDSIVENNEADRDGGGINVVNADLVVNNGSQIRDNSARTGAGIFTMNSDTSVVNSTISGNEVTDPDGQGGSSGAGGGAAVFGGNLLLDGIQAYNNFAAYRAAMAFIFGATLNINDSAIFGSSSEGDSGGVYISDDGTATIRDTTFTNSLANDGVGGAIGLSASAASARRGLGRFGPPDLTIINSQFIGSSSSEEGGAIHIGENRHVLIENSTFSGGSAERGGAIYASPDFDGTGAPELLTITGSTFENNVATREGGALEIERGQSVQINDTTFSNNTAFGEQFNIPRGVGGAIDITDADLDCSRCNFIGNEARVDGGAIRTRNSVNLTLIESNLTNNTAQRTAGAMITSTSTNLVIDGTTLANNTTANGGGAIELDGDLVMRNSTVNNNTSAQGAGGINVDGTSSSVLIINSTIAQNSGATAGGIEINQFADDVTIHSSTIADNSSTGDGGGVNLLTGGDAVVQIANSIIADNAATGVGNDIAGELSVNFTLVEDATGAILNGTNNLTGVDPLLDALANNGGLTQTMALLENSPAIDAGDPAALSGQNDVPEFDQRQVGFDRVVDGRIDMGALESQPIVGGVDGDFDDDGDFDCDDVDALVQNIAGDTGDLQFDLDGNGILNRDDLDLWLVEAGAANNASGGAYLRGDANLNGVVDISDFNIWNANKFTPTSAFCSADFNADGNVDISDFNIWNANKFNSSDSAATADVNGNPELEFVSGSQRSSNQRYRPIDEVFRTWSSI
ncbi:MAG: right-handed parallel beta-helix repeat-containing protein [Planctomycetota bacterium]